MVRLRELASLTTVLIASMSAAALVQSMGVSFRFPQGPAPIVQSVPQQQVAAQTPDRAPVLRKQVDERGAAKLVAPPTTPEQAPPESAKVPTGDEPLPEGTKAEAPLPPQVVTIDPERAGEQSHDVALRLRDSVPAGLTPYFNVFLYVSKAASGAWAQRMYIFHKSDDGTLVFEKAIPVSTGRERQEKYFTTTPTGLFELDPDRFDRTHFSHRWHGAAMPWAMFLNYTIHDHATGIALHSGIGHEADLGSRASGGCVRLPHEEARALFERFQREEAGRVPVFAFDSSTGSTRRDGTIRRDANGDPLLSPGYRVLLIIEDYPGGPAAVAIVS